jgi:hypothetical protein
MAIANMAAGANRSECVAEKSDDRARGLMNDESIELGRKAHSPRTDQTVFGVIGLAVSTWANRSAGPNDALKLSAWWRGVKLYADVTGALPFKVYERVGPEDRREAPIMKSTR